MNVTRRNKKRFERILQKTLWFGFISLLGIMSWFLIYIIAWYISRPVESVSVPTMVSSTVLFCLFVLVFIIFRKSHITLLRWSGKTVLILVLPMLLCSSMFVIMAKYLDLPDQFTNQSDPESATDPRNPTVSAPPITGQAQSPKEKGGGINCSEFTIYMKYESKNDPSLFTNENRTVAGRNGSERICYKNGVKVSSEILISMVPQTTYYGTKSPANPYSSPNSPSQPNYSQCNQFLGTGAYQACIDAVNRQAGQ